MTNPLIAIEQITYLLFLHELERLDARRGPNKASLYEDSTQICRWSNLREIKDLSQVHVALTQQVFPWLRGLGKTIRQKWGDNNDDGIEVAEYLEDAYFHLPREKTGTLERALDTVDDLFTIAGQSSPHSDLMGDIFEYLLDELRTAGKNGQFRTPRHIIRFMVSLLDPEPGAKVIDPAAGTAGFLTNTILHHRMRATPPEDLIVEWDGTPHGLIEADQEFSRDLFTGFDNDRTMVRIGWMNLILHGVANPRFELRDPLSRTLPNEESSSYKYALANPPYSGSVDKHDLNRRRVPHRKNGDPVTDRTELLFLWIMLDLLEPGGRMAVIVPEGILFGSGAAYRQLRRHLLFRHVVEAVISLPQGVFQPYTGVKTSILVVRKCQNIQRQNDEELTEEDLEEDETTEPETKKVWFYEISSDGFSLGSNRAAQPREPNDLWDALEKWRLWTDTQDVEWEDKAYWQPKVHKERWRMVDEPLEKLFPNTKPLRDKVKGIQEIFDGLFGDLSEDAEVALTSAENSAILSAQANLRHLLLKTLAQQTYARKPLFQPSALTEAQVDQAVTKLRSQLLNRSGDLLERRTGSGSFAEEHGRALLTKAIDSLRAAVTRRDEFLGRLWQEGITQEQWASVRSNSSLTEDEVENLLLPFAKLDGYDVFLRSRETFRNENGLVEPKCWIVPVQTWLKQPKWILPDGTVMPSHDADGQVVSEYKQAGLDPKTKQVRPSFLVADCIQATDFSLSAGRYKTQTELATEEGGPTATELVEELILTEKEILSALEELLGLVKD